MSRILKLYILLNFSYVLIECLIPGRLPKLRVQMDKILIDRKRQDTLEMCRIFTEETEKLEKQNKYKQYYNNMASKKTHGRVKRSLQYINSTLNEEDALRVENIVDNNNMYDDILERGEQVKYRRGNIPSLKRNTRSKKSGRRYFFAPHFIEGPVATSAPPQDGQLPLSMNDTILFKHGILPYFIDTAYYDSQLVEVIMNAFDYFEKVTCIRLQRLRERPTDSESWLNVKWLNITNPTGIKQCVHSNEQVRHKGVQMIIFGYDCMSLGDIAHELMHILGFGHEHNRSDRDQYITILWDNIKPGYKKYFKLDTKTVMENMPYDYASVLHYPSRAFTKNGQVTIMTQPGINIGQREGLSEMDTEKINALYSAECVKRNREYLSTTCPGVVKVEKQQFVSNDDIEEYYKPRIWPYGIVNYKIENELDFTQDEIENIKAVISHIEKETCIEFRYLGNDKVTVNKTIDSTKRRLSETFHNEIITDEAHIKETDGMESMAQYYSNEVFLRGGKRFLRQKKSLRYEGLMTKSNNTRYPISPARKHAVAILMFNRSAVPGCACPKTSGMPAGPVTITINDDCFNSVNDLLHLFVHILGLGHQHNSHDRDSYLHINWNELTEDVKSDVQEKLPPAASAGFPYDYQSVMHFPWLQIKDGRTNIMYPIWNDGWAMGHWQGLSSTDVLKLNKIYHKQCMIRKEAVRALTS